MRLNFWMVWWRCERKWRQNFLNSKCFISFGSERPLPLSLSLSLSLSRTTALSLSHTLPLTPSIYLSRTRSSLPFPNTLQSFTKLLSHSGSRFTHTHANALSLSPSFLSPSLSITLIPLNLGSWLKLGGSNVFRSFLVLCCLKSKSPKSFVPLESQTNQSNEKLIRSQNNPLEYLQISF